MADLNPLGDDRSQNKPIAQPPAIPMNQFPPAHGFPPGPPPGFRAPPGVFPPFSPFAGAPMVPFSPVLPPHHLHPFPVQPPPQIRAPEPPSAVPPPTSKWATHTTPEGKKYYYNKVTRETTWKKPAELAQSDGQENNGQQAKPVNWKKIPGTDWMKISTDKGKFYYHNSVTKETVWKVPEAVIKAEQNPPSALDNSEEPSKANGIVEQKSEEKERANEVPKDEKQVLVMSFEPPQLNPKTKPIPKEKTTTDDDEEVFAEDHGDGDEDNPQLHPHLMSNSESDDDSEDSAEVRARFEKANSSGSGTKASADESNVLNLDIEERVEIFKSLLREKKINQFSKWDKELHKIAFDPRYLVLNQEDRKMVFEHFVKNYKEEERKEKLEKLQVLQEEFKEFLEEFKHTFTYETTVESLHSKHKNDPRFSSLDNKEKASMLETYVAPLRQKHEESFARNREIFESLLKDFKVTYDSSWHRIKDKIRSDKRYSSLSSKDRETVFREYRNSLEKEHDEERKKREREKDAMYIREKEVKRQREQDEKERDSRLRRYQHDEAITKAEVLFSEKIHNPDAKWKKVYKTLKHDPRFDIDTLGLTELERIFERHIGKLIRTQKRSMRLEAEAGQLLGKGDSDDGSP